MAINISERRERMASLLDANRQRQEAIDAQRTSDFYRALQTEFQNLLQKGSSSVSYSNGNLQYNPGNLAIKDKTTLWNEFQRIAKSKQIPIDVETFNTLYNDFKSAQNATWRKSFDEAIAMGAREKDVHRLFRDDPRFAKDFLDIEATGFSADELGTMERLEFSKYKPSGSYMRHGDTFMGSGAIPEWMGDNPLTTTGIGLGAAGGAYMLRNKLPNFLKGGAMKSGAAAFTPMLMSQLGAPQGATHIARLASAGYLGKKAITNVPKDYKSIRGALSSSVRDGMMKDIKAMQSKELREMARAFDIKDKGIKKAALQKTVSNKIKDQSVKQTVSTLGKKKGANYLRNKAALWGVKAAGRQAAGSSLPLIGNVAMGLWSAYDLIDLGIDYFGGE